MPFEFALDFVGPAPFVDSYQALPGPNLQYIASVNNLQQLSSLPTAIQYTAGGPAAALLATPSQLQFTSALTTVPQLTGYIAPQGIFPAQQSAVAPGLFNIGASPQMATTNFIHHHIHHTHATPVQPAVPPPSGTLLYNQPASMPQSSYVIGTNNQSYINPVSNSASSVVLPVAAPQHSNLLTSQLPFYTTTPQQQSYNVQSQNTIIKAQNNTNQLLPTPGDQNSVRKIARVYPQQCSNVQISEHTTSSGENQKHNHQNKHQDPITALNNIANQPMLQEKNLQHFAKFQERTEMSDEGTQHRNASPITKTMQDHTRQKSQSPLDSDTKRNTFSGTRKYSSAFSLCVMGSI